MRRVAKDKTYKLPKKYLSGTTGSQRRQLATVTRRISELYKAGKTIPQSLINRRISLGKKS